MKVLARSWRKGEEGQVLIFWKNKSKPVLDFLCHLFYLGLKHSDFLVVGWRVNTANNQNFLMISLGDNTLVFIPRNSYVAMHFFRDFSSSITYRSKYDAYTAWDISCISDLCFFIGSG